jgi:hypothetical protein
MDLALEDYIPTTDAFNRTHPDEDAARTYNHLTLDILSQLRPIEWMVPQMDDTTSHKPAIARYLSGLLP